MNFLPVSMSWWQHHKNPSVEFCWEWTLVTHETPLHLTALESLATTCHLVVQESFPFALLKLMVCKALFDFAMVQVFSHNVNSLSFVVFSSAQCYVDNKLFFAIAVFHSNWNTVYHSQFQLWLHVFQVCWVFSSIATALTHFFWCWWLLKNALWSFDKNPFVWHCHDPNLFASQQSFFESVHVLTCFNTVDTIWKCQLMWELPMLGACFVVFVLKLFEWGFCSNLSHLLQSFVWIKCFRHWNHVIAQTCSCLVAARGTICFCFCICSHCHLSAFDATRMIVDVILKDCFVFSSVSDKRQCSWLVHKACKILADCNWQTQCLFLN